VAFALDEFHSLFEMVMLANSLGFFFRFLVIGADGLGDLGEIAKPLGRNDNGLR